MKGVKCLGLPIFFIISLLSLNLFLDLDVNALKYPINSIPIQDTTYWFETLHSEVTDEDHTFAIPHGGAPQLLLSYSSSDGVSYPHTWRFSGRYLPESNSCEMLNYSDGVNYYHSPSDKVYLTFKSFLDSNTYVFDDFNILSDSSPFNNRSPFVSQVDWSRFNGNDSSYKNALMCSLYNYGYNDISNTNNPSGRDYYYPHYDFMSLINIPLVNNRFEYEKSKPYFYQYDKIFINGNQLIDGVIMDKQGIAMSTIFDKAPPSFTDLSFKFDLFNTVSTDLSDPEFSESETVYNFDLIGSIEFDSDYTLSSSSSIKLDIDNYYNPYFDPDDMPNGFLYNDYSINNVTVYSPNSINSSSIYGHGGISKSCSITEYHRPLGDDYNRLDFSCSYNPSLDGGMSPEVVFRFLKLSLAFVGNPNAAATSANFLETTGDYTFKDFYIVTNSNYQDAGWSATSDINSGGNPESAPGNEGKDEYFSPNWDETLKNLFNFSFINPFSNIFALFTNSNNCVDIPILSGMLHSEETQVCSFFSSTIRSILTPVFGLSSMMLVFGFLVHWLGARSGNLFEDSVETDNYSFQNKFRRKK